MIETVVSVGLPVDEKLIIQKNRLEPLLKTGKEKRISIVTGIHGDELDGQFICYELVRRIHENIENLSGIVDVFPALNPLGIDSVTRGIPMFDLDMNRIFPGSESGAMTESVAAKIVDNIIGSDMCIDIHSSNIFLREVPQVRVSEDMSEKLLPYAKLMNAEFVLVHESPTVLDATLSHSLNSMGVPTLVVEMGVGMRITKEYGEKIVTGILNLMKELSIWSGEVEPVKDPIVSTDGQVTFVNGNASGIFVPCVEHWSEVKKGDHIGDVMNPLKGTIEHRVTAPVDGLIFTLREYPIVYCGSLLARILGGEQ